MPAPAPHRRPLAFFATSVTLAPAILLAAACSTAADPAADEIDQLDRFNVALATKRLCSALWVSEREREEALRTSAATFLNEKAQSALADERLRFEVDESRRMTTAVWEGVAARARFFGDQGCVILAEGSDQVMFTPVVLQSQLPPADTLPWPLGDLPSESPPSLTLDTAKVERAVEAAFSEPGDHTAAFVAVYRGQIIAERYGPGIDRDTQLESWSMGKSVTATLVGLLIEQGHFAVEDPAPVPEWAATAEDPRTAIRILDLLQMSSGLLFTHSSEDAERLAQSFIPGQPDHSLGYVAAIDVFQFAKSRPLEHPPGTVGRYRNCDPLILGSIVKRTVEGMGEPYLSWPQHALFDRIGTRRQVLETDLYGNFVLTGFDFGTGRGWARLGMLFLQDGVWEGERLLPDGFVELVSSPAQAWSEGEYGGLFWVGHPALPEGTYSMRGAGGQEVSIVPSHELVLVRLGHTLGAAGDYATRRNLAYGLIVQAIDPSWELPADATAGPQAD